jgi:hypothetical protein
MDETRRMYEESRDVLYQWAGSWALNGFERANLDMDAGALRDVVDSFYDDAGKRAKSSVVAGSFARAFRAHCSRRGSDCAVRKSYLKNVVNPRAAPEAEVEALEDYDYDYEDEDEDDFEERQSAKHSSSTRRRASRSHLSRRARLGESDGKGMERNDGDGASRSLYVL